MQKWVQTEDLKVIRGNVVLNIGDDIEYHDCAGDNESDLYKGKWQVLGVDDKGNLLIVTKKNVTTYHFNKECTLKGAKDAYSNGVQILDNICSIYSKGRNAISSRSIRLEDVDTLTGYDKTTCERKKVYTNKRGNEFIWHDGNKWCTTKRKKEITLMDNLYTYSSEDETLNISEKVQQILIPYRNYFDSKYWLASPFICAHSHYISYGLRLVHFGYVQGNAFISLQGIDYDYFGYERGVRAVVSLK